MGSLLHWLCLRIGLLFAVCYVAPFGAPGQAPSAAVNSAGLWLQYTGDHPVGKSIQVHFDAILARGGNSYKPDFILVRPGVRRTIHGPISAMLAYAYFEAYEARTGVKASLQEHRISQDLQWAHSLLSPTPEHAEVVLRFRYEERFRKLEGTSSPDWSVAQRTRYLVAAKVPAPWKPRDGRPGYLNLYDEVFVAIATPRERFGFDQNQSGVGVGWHLHGGIDLEFGYLYAFAAASTPQIGTQQHILRLNLVSHSPLLHR